MTDAAETRNQIPSVSLAEEKRSVAELVENASTQLTRLVRDEMRLAVLETQAKAGGIAKGAGIAGAGALLAFYGGATLVAAAVLGLSRAVPDWAAALIIAAVLLVLGGVLALAGKKTVGQAAPPVPTDTLAGVRDDVETIKERGRR
ncbi:phage holin family protein [Nocardia sp. NPDC056000]|uniref:phage holin family protein n=1 Tax=Nocardia sp. NPDC056000 TaxID=3345674 RepID=UPI0035E1C5FF